VATDEPGMMQAMSGVRPILLVDVDGVLNPFAADRCPGGYREYALFPDEEPVRLADVHGEWLRALTEVFDLVWATGWGDEAHRLISPILRLPEFPAIRFPPAPFEPSEKVPAIHSFVGERPVAWLDDVITPEARRWAAERFTPTLLVFVDPTIGLTEELVEEVRSWAAGVRHGMGHVPDRPPPTPPGNHPA
jgi:Swiss Army Knife RNA repair-like protein